MSRSFIFWFLVLIGWWAGESIAQTQRPAPKPRTTGPEFVVDVRQFGAVADGKTDNAAAFQRAVDHLASRMDRELPQGGGHRATGVVFIPSSAGTYRISRPIWVDHSFIEIRGEGQGSRVEAFPMRSHPLFLFGLRRVAQSMVKDKRETLEVTAKYRPDLFGRLDTSAAPSKGVRGGFRTHGETLIQAQASPLSDGPRHSRQDWTTDHWTVTTRLTVELAVEGTAGGPMPATTALFGIGVGSNERAYPIVVYTEGANQYLVKFATQAKRFGPLIPHRFGFTSGNAKGMQRLTLQIDLESAEVSAFVNGRAVAVQEGLGPAWKPGMHFAENDYFPLLIGDGGGDRPGLGSTSGKDWTLAGFLFSRTIRYRKTAPGQIQQRAEGSGLAINDEYRYFTRKEDDKGTIGYLAFTDRPDESGRVLTIQGGPASNEHQSSAFLIHSLQNQQGGIMDNGIRDIHLVGAKLYGQNVAVGQVLDLRITGVRSSDSYHAIGSLNNGANYLIRLEDCTLDATDSGYYGLDQLIWARNLHFSGSGRVTMRLVGCSANVENVFVGFHSPDNQSTLKLHAGDYGGNYAFRNVQVDYEGDTYSHTPIYAEVHPYAPETTLRLTDIFLGTVGEGVPLITLRNGDPNWRKSGYLSVDILQSFTKNAKVIAESNGPGWRGIIRGVRESAEVRQIQQGVAKPWPEIRIEP